MNDNDVYIVYSIDKSYEGKAIYPDDPRVIEAIVHGWDSAEAIVMYNRGIDDTRLYGCECWEVFDSAEDYFQMIHEGEE